MKANEPGFRKLFVPDAGDMRPSARHPEDREGDGRDGLKYATGSVDFCQDFRSDSSTVSTSPASARFTPGMPTRKPRESKDEGIEIQMGIPRT
jgi:hypothetical protein